jgi:hypothetical protein
MTDFAKVLTMLQNPRANSRYDACEELRVAETITPDAAAALKLALADPDPSVAEAAQRALEAHSLLESRAAGAGTAQAAPPTHDPVMLLAASIVKDPRVLDAYPGSYLVVYDQSVTYPRFDNLNRALCVAADRGWRALSISNLNMPILTGTQSMMYVLLERLPVSTRSGADHGAV